MSNREVFKKGSWNVDTKGEGNTNVIVIGASKELSEIIDSFQNGEVFGQLRNLEEGVTVTMDSEVMGKHGYDPKAFSSIYSLNKIEGSKVMKVFTDNETDNLISFNGTCLNTYSMRAERGTKQFEASLFRIRHKEDPQDELHFLTERERRDLNLKQQLARSERNREKEQVLRDSRESRLRQQEQRKVYYMTKDQIRDQLMKMFNHQEYITLNEAINSCGGNKAAIEETLKEIAIIQKSGKHVNSYRLLDSYRFK